MTWRGLWILVNAGRDPGRPGYMPTDPAVVGQFEYGGESNKARSVASGIKLTPLPNPGLKPRGAGPGRLHGAGGGRLPVRPEPVDAVSVEATTAAAEPRTATTLRRQTYLARCTLIVVEPLIGDLSGRGRDGRP